MKKTITLLLVIFALLVSCSLHKADAEFGNNTLSLEDRFQVIGNQALELTNTYFYENNKDSALVQLYALVYDTQKTLPDQKCFNNLLSNLYYAIENDYITGDRTKANKYYHLLNLYFSGMSVGEKLSLSIQDSFIDDSTIVFELLDDSTNTIVYNMESDLFGLYDLERKIYVIEPSTTYLSPCGDGLLCIEKSGYYGAIDCNGERAIGFYYEDPFQFEFDELAVIRINGLFGVINTKGEEILSTKFLRVDFYKNAATADILIDASLFRDNEEMRGLYNTKGTCLVPHNYDGFTFCEEYIYASTIDSDGYELYDYNGYCLIGDNSNNDAYRIWLPEKNELSLVEYKFDSNQRSAYPINGDYTIYNYDYMYLDSNLKPINNIIFSYSSGFNTLDLSFIELTQYTEYYNWAYDKTYIVSNSAGYAVMRGDGSIFYYLPRTFTISNYYGDYQFRGVNEYYLYLSRYYNAVLGTDLHLFLVDLSNNEMTSWAKIEMVDGTNCTILADPESGLLGMLDGDELVLEFVYNSIVYDEQFGQIIAIRGAEQNSYTPQKMHELEYALDNLDQVADSICPDMLLSDRRIK